MRSDAGGLATGAVPELIAERYRIGKRLGRGGFGAVYEAVDQRLDKKVAVKILDEDRARSDAGVRQFRAEALAASRLRHPGIIAVTDYEVLPDGRPFLVMEFATGETLETVLDRRGALPPDEVVKIGRDIATAVAVAHAGDIVHRDLKPANVMYEPDGPAAVKILDFGVAKIANVGKTSTGEGTLVGTPHYMAPEQIREHVGPIGPCTDVYAIGVILYELLSGNPPFAKVNMVAELLLAQLSDPPPPLPASVPAWLGSVVMRALEKAPADRFGSAQALADALASQGATAPRAAGPGLPPAPRSRSRRLVLGATVGVTVALATVVAVAIRTTSGTSERAPAPPTPPVPALSPVSEHAAAAPAPAVVPRDAGLANEAPLDAAAVTRVPTRPVTRSTNHTSTSKLPDAPRETFEVPKP